MAILLSGCYLMQLNICRVIFIRKRNSIVEVVEEIFGGVIMPDHRVGRPGRVRQYLSTHKHQANNLDRKPSKWMHFGKEIDTFDVADYGNFNKQPGESPWEDDKMNLWGVLPGLEYVGTLKQQIGFFPKTKNPTDDWHGYPVAHDYRNMDKWLIEFLIGKGVIDLEDVPNLLKGKKIG